MIIWGGQLLNGTVVSLDKNIVGTILGNMRYI